MSSASVRVRRAIEDFLRRTHLDDLARIHHSDAVANLRRDAKVMRDEQDGGVFLPAKVIQQLQHLRLNCHIQRCRRLVGNQTSGLLASAIAIPTRWRMPPDSSCG